MYWINKVSTKIRSKLNNTCEQSKCIFPILGGRYSKSINNLFRNLAYPCISLNIYLNILQVKAGYGGICTIYY